MTPFSQLSKFFCWIAALGVFALGMPQKSYATLSISPTNGGSASGPVGGGGVTNTLYYFVKTATTSGLPVPPSFFATAAAGLDITKTAATDSGLANQFVVNLTSDATNYNTVTGNQQVVVTIQAYPQVTGGAVHYAPIASVNGVACTPDNCQGFNPPSLGYNRYYAAKYYPSSNRSIQIGFYLSDICSDYFSIGGTAQGCTSSSPSSVTAPTAGSPSSMQLSFTVSVAPDGNQMTLPTGTALDSTATPVTFSLQIDTPSFVCADSTTLQNSYRPGDGQIFYTPNGMALSPPSSGDAPAKNLYVIGNENAAPFVGSNFLSNQIQASLQAWPYEQPVGGFKNSSKGDEHPYNLTFLYLDYAGIYTPPASVSSCQIQGVEASLIQGAAGKSNCFIATAAFGSGETAPVLLLRKFRDEVLLDYDWGQTFVSWYYSWSPGAADWLMEHPIFRLPMLMGLAPLEFFAWACVHPFFAMVWGFSGFIILFGILIGLSQSKSRRSVP